MEPKHNTPGGGWPGQSIDTQACTPLDWEQAPRGHANYSREDLSPETLPTFIELIWRDLTWESTFTPPQGMDHAVILLRGVSSLDSELMNMLPANLIVRAPYTEAYRVQASRESGIITALSGRSNARLPQTVRQAHVPRRFTGNQRKIRVTLTSYIEGQPLTAEVWEGMTEMQQFLVVEQLGSLLAAMHTMNSSLPPVSNLESWWADSADDDGSLRDSTALNYADRSLPGKHELMRSRMAEVLKPNLSAEEYARAEAIMADVDEILARPDLRRCLTHGDMHTDHLLWKEDGGIGVIDFSDMTVGDPAWDYAHFEAVAPGLTARIYEYAKLVGEDVKDPQVVFDDPDLLARAATYKRWDNLFLLIDHFRTGHSPRVEI